MVFPFAGPMGFGPMARRRGAQMAGSPYEPGVPGMTRPPAAALPKASANAAVEPYIGGETPNGDPRGQAKDLRSFEGLSDYFNDPGVRADFRGLGQMVQVMSPTMVGAKMAAPGMFGALPGTDAGLGGGGGGVSAADLGASLAEGNTTGMFEHGGVVRKEDLRGPNPPGRDEGYVAVHRGELILNKPQQRMLMKALLGR